MEAVARNIRRTLYVSLRFVSFAESFSLHLPTDQTKFFIINECSRLSAAPNFYHHTRCTMTVLLYAIVGCKIELITHRSRSFNLEVAKKILVNIIPVPCWLRDGRFGDRVDDSD